MLDRSRFSRPLVVALLVFALPGDVDSQTLRGRVLEERSETPVGNAIVRLLDREAETRALAATDSLGRYSIEAPSPGEFYISVEGFGYETTRSPLLALVNPDGSFALDLTLNPSPLGLPGFEVSVERYATVDRRLRQMVGISMSALRVPLIRRPQIVDHLMKNHNLEDVVRWTAIPSLEIRQSENGPCFLVRPGATVKIPESCVEVYLNGAQFSLRVIPALPLDMIETIVVVLPSESILYPNGAVLLYTASWIG